MKCKLCNGKKIKTIYNGFIRNGGLGKHTTQNVSIYQCEECRVIWHDNQFDNVQRYYESKEYREELEGSSEADKFYELHDKETLDKLTYTGTDIYRNKVVVFVQVINVDIATGNDNAVADAFIYINGNILHAEFGLTVNIMHIRHTV